MEQAALVESVKLLGEWVWGWPLLGFILLTAVIMTFSLSFVQVRYFFTSWKLVLFSGQAKGAQIEGELTPFQAFINALSASIGNGSLAGMATAITAGGPGAAFWLFILGFIMLPIRYAEVYASTAFATKANHGGINGGPMAYMSRVPGGSILPALYAIFCLGLTFVSGNAAQCNSIGLSLKKMAGIDLIVIAFVVLAFLLYVMLGGARRIIRVSDMIVPIKVGLFFITSFTILIYYYQSIWPALLLIVRSALTPKAVYGAATGFTIQNALRFATARVLNATEMGLGTAGVLFGATRNTDPVRNGIMSMVSAFISNYFVCFVLFLCFIVTNTWNTGAQSTELTIAAFSTVFGNFGGWVVTFLSMAFGMGVIVSYAFIGRECWLYLTNGRWFGLYALIYCAVAFLGTLAKVDIVWYALDIVNAGLLVINLYSLLFLLPEIVRGLKAHKNQI